MSNIPSSRPQAKRHEIVAKVPTWVIQKYQVILVGIRGYYRDSMGEVGKTTAGFTTTRFSSLLLISLRAGTQIPILVIPTDKNQMSPCCPLAFTFTSKAATVSVGRLHIQHSGQQRLTKNCQSPAAASLVSAWQSTFTRAA